MTQSDPSSTPQGSGGVATGHGSEADGGSANGNGTGDAERRSAPAARSDQAPRRQRVIPPLRKSESDSATEGPAPAQKVPAGSQPASSTTTQKAPAKTTLASGSSTKAQTKAPSKAAAKAPAKTGRPAPARTSAGASAASRRPRRARLRLTQIDAWTVMKTAFLLSIALGIVSVVAVAIVWTVLGAAGVFDSLNGTVQTLLGNDFRVQDYIGTGRVLGFTMVLAVVDVVLLTAIATLGAFLYNLSATLLGGVELTLTEDG